MSEKFSSTAWIEIESSNIQKQTVLILSSYKKLLGKDLLETNDFQSLYEADFIILSHDGKEDPCFTYANRAAQELWKISWDDFIGMPSKYSAEPDQRESRSEMLSEAMQKGYFDSYTGVRISSEGRRFFIESATIFNLIDESGSKVGQAATFKDWQYID